MRSLTFLLFLLIFSIQRSFGQNLSLQFKKEFISKIKTLPKTKYLNKTVDFYFNNDLDSTLLFTQKIIETEKVNATVFEYTYLLRGLSLKEKRLYEESKKMLSKIKPSFYFYPQVTASLAEVALNKDRYDESIGLFKQIENIQNPEIYNIKKSRVKHNLGIAYLLKKDFSKAEKYLLEDVKLTEIDKDTVALISTYSDLANLYYEQYKDDLAIPYFKKGYDLAKKTKNFMLKATTAHNMAIVEENRKNFELANNFRKEYGVWKDSANDQNKIWEVAQLEKQFAIKEKQKKVSLLQAENKLKIAERNGFLYSSVILLVLLMTSFYFYIEKSKRNRIISKQKQKLDELNVTKDKLFSIVSHDLRSSVNALKTSTTRIIDNINESNWEDAASDLKQNSAIANSTYNLLDNLLHWALLQNKQSFFEISPLRLFFIVEQVSYNYKSLVLEKNITLENTVDKKTIVSADQESIKIVLRNLIDNSIKFSNPNGFIKIYSEDKAEYWDLTIEDNGKGMSESTKNRLLNEDFNIGKKENENTIGSGLGMQLCKSMIQKNNGRLNIISEPGKGTKMIVSLPKQNSNG